MIDTKRIPYVLMVAGALLVACGAADDVLDDDDSSTDDDDDQAPVSDCVELLACVAAVDAGSLDEQTAIYGPDGSCWDGEDPAQCDEDCWDARLTYELLHPTVAACWDDGSPSPLAIFGAGVRWYWMVDSCSLVAHITEADSELSGNGFSTFVFQGAIANATDEWAFSTNCSFEGRDFGCDDFVASDVSEVWSFSGAFAEDFLTAEWLLTVDYDGIEFPCSFDGYPYP